MCKGKWIISRGPWRTRLPLPVRSTRGRLLPRALSLAAASGFLFLLFACAGTQLGSGTLFPYDELTKAASARVAMSGNVRITTRNQEGKSVTAPGVLLVRWPDEFRVEVQSPVGSVLALLVVHGDRFWLYEQSRKENLTGPLRDLPGGYFQQLGQVDLVKVFLARPTLEPFRGKVLPEAGTAQVSGSPFSETLRWRGHLLDEWTLARQGGWKESVSYEEYTARAGVDYPTKVRLGRDDQHSVLVDWKDWEPSVPAEKSLFQIPQQQQFGRPTKALP